MKTIFALLAGLVLSLTPLRAADAENLYSFDLFSTTVLSNAVNTAGSGAINVPFKAAPVIYTQMFGAGAATDNVIFTYQGSLDGANWATLQTVTNALNGTNWVRTQTILNTNTTPYRLYRLYSITSVATNSFRLIQKVPYVLYVP